MDPAAFERFLSLAQRELAADDVRRLEPGQEPPEADNVVLARLADGSHVVASFADPPKDREALTRRLAMLADTFAEALAGPPSERTRARQPVVTSLHEELKALAARARAADAVVIDGDSPVVWGCASVRGKPRARTDMLLRDVSDRELSSHADDSSPSPLHAVPDESGPLLEQTAPTGVLRMAPPPPESAAFFDNSDEPTKKVDLSSWDPTAPEVTGTVLVDDDPTSQVGQEPEITKKAIAEIRTLSSLDQLHKGRHLRHASNENAHYLVLSFSGIYLLCLVFDGEFDELRAERAAQESLPRIERLVLALPPLDPEPQPMGGVVAIRRPKRR